MVTAFTVEFRLGDNRNLFMNVVFLALRIEIDITERKVILVSAIREKFTPVSGLLTIKKKKTKKPTHKQIKNSEEKQGNLHK